MPETYLARTKLAFKLSEIVQGLEEDKIAFKMFLSDLASVQTNDDELRQLVDRIRSRLSSNGPKNDRSGKWKDILTELLSEKSSTEAQDFIKELGDLLD